MDAGVDADSREDWTITWKTDDLGLLNGLERRELGNLHVCKFSPSYKFFLLFLFFRYPFISTPGDGIVGS